MLRRGIIVTHKKKSYFDIRPSSSVLLIWYTYLPKPVYEQEVVTVLWNQQYIETEKLQQLGKI